MIDPTSNGPAKAMRLEKARDQMRLALAIIDECDELVPAAVLEHAIRMLELRLSCLASNR